MRRILAVPLSALLLLSSWGGCASGRSDLLARYDTLPYRDTFHYAARSTDVMRSIADAVMSRGGTVTLIDHQTGLLNAEMASAEQIPEELHANADEDDESLVTAIFAGIVAVFVFIILFGWLGDGCGSSDTTDDDQDNDEGRDRGKNRPRTRERLPDRDRGPDIDVHIGGPDVDPVKGYRYILSFSLTPEQTGGTRVRMRTLRMEAENGVVVRTTHMQNKYLLYSLDELIRTGLPRPS